VYADRYELILHVDGNRDYAAALPPQSKKGLEPSLPGFNRERCLILYPNYLFGEMVAQIPEGKVSFKVGLAIPLHF
jgi:hypothetical protein